MTVEVYSFEYLADESRASEWTIYPSRDVWERLMRREEGSRRWIARLNGELSICCSDPLEYESRGRIYCPRWVLDGLGLDGGGEEVEVEWQRCEELPSATRLVFRPSRLMEGDPREMMEGPLSQLGVLRAGMMLPMPDGGEGYMLAEVCEPADEVFLDGHEVEVEFEDKELREEAEVEAAIAAVAAAAAVPAPTAPTNVTSAEDFDDGGMLPAGIAPQLRGGFVPFSGRGHTLR
jgi:hypothetical protein